MSLVKEYLQLHFIVFLWGFAAILGLLIELPVIEMVFYRTLIAASALLIILLMQKGTISVSGRGSWRFLATGILFAAHWILFFYAARISNVSVSLVGYATCAFWTSLLEPLVSRQKVKSHEVILGVIVLAGIYVIFSFDFAYVLGLLMGIGSGILAAFFGVLNKQFIKSHSHLTITFYEMTGACISILVFLSFYGAFGNAQLDLSPSAMYWLYLLILALVCTVYTISTSIKLMKKISAYALSLVFNLESVYGIILALIIFGESEYMAFTFYLGAGIIIFSILAYPALNRYYDRKSLPLDHIR